MASTLRKLKINEVSLVDKGANPHALIKLRKIDDDDRSTYLEAAETILQSLVDAQHAEDDGEVGPAAPVAKFAPVEPMEKAKMPYENMVFGPACQEIVDAAIVLLRSSEKMSQQQAYARAFEDADSTVQRQAIDEERRAKRTQAMTKGDGEAGKQMQMLADGFRAAQAAIGVRLTPEQAYTRVFTDPGNGSLAQRVRNDERRG